MNKRICNILIILGITLGIIMAITYLYHSGLTQKTRSNRTNTAKEIILSSRETYTVGEDIEEGYYDINYISGGNNEKIIFDGISLSVNDELINIPLNRGFKFTLMVEDLNGDGKGKLKFKPASFQGVKVKKNRNFILYHTGYYVVGKDIPVGEYKAKLISADEDSYDSVPDVGIMIYPNISNMRRENHYHFEQVYQINKIALKENEVLYLYKIREGLDYKMSGKATCSMGYEADDLEVIFELNE